MRVMVAFEHRFIKDKDGHICTQGTIDYGFLKRYLKVFDEVVVIARVNNHSGNSQIRKLSEGPGVKFCELPYYYGPVQYAKNFLKIRKVVRRSIDQADAYILRVAGTISTLVYNELRRKKKPYGVEVVADPWDVLSPGSVKTKLRPFLRHLARYQLKKQCLFASVASYVTEYSLQKRYPPGGWSTHYSTIDLPNESILDHSIVEKRAERIKAKLASNQPLRLCCTGQMSQLYKAQDILIASFAKCLSQGMNLELWLFGDGSFRPQLEKQAHGLGVSDKIKFWGNVPAGRQIFEKLDEADVFILPSRQEGLPRAMIEAMARCLPCIGSTVGGFVELVGPKYIVKPNSVEYLADKISEIVRDPQQMHDMSKKNLQKAHEYSINILQKRRNQMYQKLVEITAGSKNRGVK